MASIEKLVSLASDHLQPGETVIASVMGAYETKILGKDSVRNGVFLATNNRIFFFGKKMFGFDTESFPYSNISSFEYGKGMMGKTISFFASGNTVKMKWINKGDVDKFIEHIRQSIGKKSAEVPSLASVTTPSPGASDVAEQIRQLAELKSQGHITEEEFTAKKKQLLGI